MCWIFNIVFFSKFSVTNSFFWCSKCFTQLKLRVIKLCVWYWKINCFWVLCLIFAVPLIYPVLCFLMWKANDELRFCAKNIKNYYFRRRRQEPWDELAFLVNDLTPWNLISRRYGLIVHKAPHFLWLLVHSWRPLKIWRKDWFSRLFVLITAAALLGEQPLVDRM